MKASAIRTTSFATVTLAALLLLVAVPQRAAAGDDEWATAGKILTGAVAASVLFNVLDDSHDHHHRRHATVERTVIIGGSDRHCASPRVSYRSYRSHVYRRPVVVRREYYYDHPRVRPRVEIHHHYDGCGHAGYERRHHRSYGRRRSHGRRW